MKNSLPENVPKTAPNGRSRTPNLLSNSALEINALLHTQKYYQIVSSLLEVEGGEVRNIADGVFAKKQHQEINRGNLYSLPGRDSPTSGLTNDEIADNILNRIKKGNSIIYQELSLVPLAKWGAEHINIARQIMSADCIRKYGLTAKFITNEELYSRFIKILSHFKQLEKLEKESKSLPHPFERARIGIAKETSQISPGTGKNIRATGFSVRRVLSWMTGGKIENK